jgi:hypothetical protein
LRNEAKRRVANLSGAVQLDRLADLLARGGDRIDPQVR